ncbi:uncharacterized protein YdaT [Chryseomicrobium aureum]|uniref:DUF2188 domain-containing protein n=1 Tax=Chryseomicrobium aureum TaxID=1441723 RepID=UPI00195832D7|nr:DUF2188 domain-containing protein [Chryseomicrobium aureum]MBM7705847.1 uncharacterized protein YdaT [Chryseomicrobium aureum]
MPWTKTDYPDSMKNLDASVRNKAIEMANAMVDDGMEEGRAISIATAKARDYVSGSDNSSRPHYVVKAHEDDWILMKQDGERAIKTATTKESLLQEAKTYVNDKDGILKVYKQDGSVEDTYYE